MLSGCRAVERRACMAEIVLMLYHMYHMHPSYRKYHIVSMEECSVLDGELPFV